MDISIVIINYNTFQLTCNCIQSIIDHTSGVVYEIILVDNASTECNADMFLNKFDNIKLIKSAENGGFARGNNQGIRHAKGKYILLLNSDTLLLENSILYAYNKCSGIKNLGAATVKLIFPDKSIQPAAQKFPSVFVHFLKTTRLWKLFKKTYQSAISRYDYNQTFACDWIWGTFFMFPRTNLQYMNGKLTETYFMYSEDIEWCFIFKKNQLDNYYLGESAVIHLGGKSSTSKFKNRVLIKNHLHFIKFNYGYWQFCFEKILLFIDRMEDLVRGRSNK